MAQTEAFRNKLKKYRAKRAELKAKHPDWSKAKIHYFAAHSSQLGN